ncbi:MAG: BolA family transcriptional regulator [Hyphomonadaceae bacterium]
MQFPKAACNGMPKRIERLESQFLQDDPMAMTVQELDSLLREALPDADIQIKDLAGDGDHYKATIRSAAFEGKSRVAQHQMVYAALKGRMGGELHALALDTAPKT